MTITKPKLVTVFGGSGFIGRHVVRALAKRGYRVRVAVRRPDLAFHLQPLGGVGQIQAVQANLRFRESVDRAVAGSDHVINLVGLLFESGKQRFGTVHESGARAVAEAARAAGVPLTHMSAIGADARSHSAYASTKGRAEAAVRSVLPDAVIVRPSIVFGPEDAFFNKFASMARLSPFLPLIGGGTTKFQPVYVGDVAEVFARSVDGALKPGEIYELGGGEVLTFKQCLEAVLRVIGRKRLFVPIPFWVAKIQGTILGYLPKPPLTKDQVILLQKDNVVSEGAKKEERTLEGLGIHPQTIETILPSYLWRFRAHGQYSSQTPT
ncbi:complex I NDUFA9 subunit family protein [Phyllobacterium zundukense]|uniref:Complex I NDUFA9 subunit family protein n=1 Tax=Phyllobacterium zundukense TaxID=1867719 RepID=A0A2N9VTB7_9HYPH|nr:complex I NDUFA9 subunit family protein [Phyllobacterium zundukense]ATU93312.1 complex I NDUFA9 subunit family protein [Phyllobacterium zundukense]PIO42735.1 complex I NDUFA9 subunit family protein [Phyllobacterium zundukense]